MYKMVKNITDGKVDDPAPYIKDKLGSRWVFSDAEQNTDFLARLLESGWADTVYEDGEAYILKIRDVKGEPAAPRPAVAPVQDAADESPAEEETPDEAAPDDPEETPPAGESSPGSEEIPNEPQT
jgi:hypothetical protein